MTESVSAAEAARIHQLSIRAHQARLTLISPHEDWLIVDQPGVTYASCPSLAGVEAAVERYIETREAQEAYDRAVSG